MDRKFNLESIDVQMEIESMLIKEWNIESNYACDMAWDIIKIVYPKDKTQ